MLNPFSIIVKNTFLICLCVERPRLFVQIRSTHAVNHSELTLCNVLFYYKHGRNYCVSSNAADIEFESSSKIPIGLRASRILLHDPNEEAV